MYRRVAAVCIALAVAGIGLPESVAKSGAVAVVFASPEQAYDKGLADWAKGDTGNALEALGYAADNGLLDAQIHLAELYARGEGVPKNDAKAFGYYQSIAIRFADAGPRHPFAERISEALVALAGYFRSGIPVLDMKPDPAKAAGLYRHAASYFGNAAAQFELARMYLKGEGVNRNVRLAINWLMNASRKQHAPSQALLGDLLWRGAGDGYHQPLNGLALLSLAHKRAAGTSDQAWIDKLYRRSAAEALPEQRERASQIAAHWRNRGARSTAAPVVRLSPTPSNADVSVSEASTALKESETGIQTIGAVDTSVPPR